MAKEDRGKTKDKTEPLKINTNPTDSINLDQIYPHQIKPLLNTHHVYPSQNNPYNSNQWPNLHFNNYIGPFNLNSGNQLQGPQKPKVKTFLEKFDDFLKELPDKIIIVMLTKIIITIINLIICISLIEFNYSFNRLILIIFVFFSVIEIMLLCCFKTLTDIYKKYSRIKKIIIVELILIYICIYLYLFFKYGTYFTIRDYEKN
ncbi:hypothetical protein GVAV_000465 [Gurleya vavrai]